MTRADLIAALWPFVPRQSYQETLRLLRLEQEANEAVRLENYTLRDALREANAEVRRQREAIAALKARE